MNDIKKLIGNDAELCEKELERLLDKEHIGEGELQRAMRYAVLGGGKRIRAFLVLEFCRLFSGDCDKALPFAAAIEMIHAYSLIHDDLPCMDDDDMRRGKPSCHIAFGEATALLAGDTLLTYAMEAVSSAKTVSESTLAKIVFCFARNAGSLGMAGGQQTDLEGNCDTYEKLEKLHSMKTGALIKAAATAGYLAACDGEADEKVLEDISEYAECIGLAFQIKDDLLDLEGDAAVLGKKVGIDEKNGRVNALTFFTPEEARRECERLAKLAENAVKKYPDSEILAALPHYLNLRNK